MPPRLLDHLEELLPTAPWARLGLIVDFDGTISEIAPTPDAAALYEDAARPLARLASTATLVCVLSGRSAGDVARRVGLDGVVYVGNHGAEYLVDGEMVIADGAGRYRAEIRRVMEILKAGIDLPGLVWDDKGYTASVHYRLADDPGLVRRRLTAALESAPGRHELEVFWGKMVLEIRPPIGIDKGAAVRRLVHEHRLEAAIVIGDDTTDLDAFHALHDLTAAGRLTGTAVVVRHHDSPDDLLVSADYVLDGVPEVVDFLRWLDGVVSP